MPLSGDHEYDLLLMHHEIGVAWPDMTSDVHHVDLTVYGDSQYSAMAKTVGYPTGIAAKMILDGKRTALGEFMFITRF